MKAAALLLAALLLSGCAGYPSKRRVLTNPGDAEIITWVRSEKTSAHRLSTSEEIAQTGVARGLVGHSLIPVRHFEVAKYQPERLHFYFGWTCLFRTFLFPIYLVAIAPFDLLLSMTHAGPTPIAHDLFRMDEEWVVDGEIEERRNVTESDPCDRSRFEPEAGVACRLTVREGAGPRYSLDKLETLAVLEATSDAEGACVFDLRPLAGERWSRDRAWTITFEATSGDCLSPLLIVPPGVVRRILEAK